MYEKCDIKFGTCVYCGKIRTITDDHIPPSSIFAKPKPNNLITVPSCHYCNQGSSKDDEYFRFTLTIRKDVSQHPDVLMNYPVVLRSLNKENKIGFKEAILNSLKLNDVFTKSGIYIGKENTMDIDLLRLNKVVERIIKGLFYNHSKQILPLNYKTVAYNIDCFKYFSSDLLLESKKNILDPLRTEKIFVIGNNTFEYKYKFANDNRNISVWSLRFYNKVYFFGATLPLNL